ncbi:uncharacterized protein LOC134823902 [Bolinopsis microptera]|uniref:uncharacterized protein LOC134823902 n=1 Tax=Bolinopsis microptera TaxID=2820187 RepID=UPI003079ABAE
MYLITTVIVLLTVNLSEQTSIMTYMMSPTRHSQTLVEGEVTVPRDLANFTFCLRVKPRLAQDCEPIAVSYKDRNTGAELIRITTGNSKEAPSSSDKVLQVWTRYCPEVFHLTPQLRCDGIWRTVCVDVTKNTEIALTVQRFDQVSESQRTTRSCRERKIPRYDKFATPVIKNGGKFTFNTIQIGDKTIISDSKIKDVMLWENAFKDISLAGELASGVLEFIPNRQQIVWIFNSKASLMQSGEVDVKERPYGKGMIASPEYQLVERGEKAVLTCQVLLNDFSRVNNTGAGVRWFHQDIDNISKSEKNHGHTHEVQSTEDDDGDISIYTLDSSVSDPFSQGWFYCQRNKIKDIEKLHKSNIVHITIADKVCKAIKRKDDKYGTLEFAAATPGNYSTAKCPGGDAKMLCTSNSTWDVENCNFSCNTLIYNTLSDIINGTTPHPSALSQITPQQFDKMTNNDFRLVVGAVRRVQNYLYDRKGVEVLLDWMGELMEVPSRVPITTRQLFPEVTEELVGKLTEYVQQSETLHQEHFSILISKRVDGDFTGDISDRTRPNVKISLLGETDWMVAIYYREDSWFKVDNHNSDVIIHSPVVGIKISNHSALPVTITFHKNYNSDNRSRCVYWDVEEVGWKSDNCTTQELGGGRVQCVCHHLTSFAILMDPFTDLANNPFQSFLTKVVLSVSIVFLIFSIIIWISFKSLRKLTYIKLRSSFSSCLCTASFFFLLTGETPRDSRACYSFTFLMQWMYLATFGWMVVDAYWLRLKIVHSLDSYGVYPRQFFKKAFFGTLGERSLSYLSYILAQNP